jgi:hypothetical protein
MKVKKQHLKDLLKPGAKLKPRTLKNSPKVRNAIKRTFNAQKALLALKKVRQETLSMRVTI